LYRNTSGAWQQLIAEKKGRCHTLVVKKKGKHLPMAYTTNPYAPTARMKARNDVVERRLSYAQAGRKYGVHRSTILRWVQKAKLMKLNGHAYIWTQSSAAHRRPNMLKPKVVDRIITLRKELKRCAPVIHQHLLLEGFSVSLSSVERVLRRLQLVRKKKRARWYTPLPRPVSDAPGSLVQMDTIHYVKPDKSRFYLYTVIDTYSRLAYAEYHPKLSQSMSQEVLTHAQKLFGFHFTMVQTDSGPEFSYGLQASLGRRKIKLRHSRVRTPNDNAHIERFNRTIQEECFNKRLPNEDTINKQLQNYIAYYNHHRLHLSLQLQTPIQFVAKVLK
jgi:transposase InsO family protein